MTLGEYPFTRRLDVRTATARALARHLMGLQLDILTSRDVQRLVHVFDEWPEFEEKHEPPSACVLPSEGAYEDRALGPSPLQDTWRHGGDGQGFVLWKVSEYVIPLDVFFRGRDLGQRHAVLGALEDAFVPADLGAPSDTGGDVYGILITVSDYYDRVARYTLRAGRVDDSPEATMRNAREGVLRVVAHVEHVIVRPAVGFRPRVEIP